MSDQQDNRWHVSKAIDVGNVVAIIGLIIGLFVFVQKFDNRITTLEVNQRHLILQQERDREDTRALLQEMRSDLKYIRDRVDEVEHRRD